MKKCETTAWHVYNFITLRIKQTILIFDHICCFFQFILSGNFLLGIICLNPLTSTLIQAPLWHLWRLCRSRFPFSLLLCPVDFLSHGSLLLTLLCSFPVLVPPPATLEKPKDVCYWLDELDVHFYSHKSDCLIFAGK